MRLLSLCCLLTLVAVPSWCLAQNASDAKRLYDQGVADAKQGRYMPAALAFEAAFREHPHAASLFSAASAWEEAGNLPRAADAWAGALAAPGLSRTQTERAQQRLRIIEGEVATVVVTILEPAPNRMWQGKLGDNSFFPLPTRLHAHSGSITLLLRDETGRIERRLARTLWVTNGAVESVRLEAPTETSAVTESVTARPQHNAWLRPRTVVAASLATAGAAALVGSAIAWSKANDTHDAFTVMPSWALRDRGESQVRWTNILAVGGTALVAAGAAIWLWPPHAAEPPVVHPVLDVASVGIAGSF